MYNNNPTAKVCQAKDCGMDAVLTTVVHKHTQYEKCYPYDLGTHNFYQLCKYHNRILMKRGESMLMLKDIYYV